MENQTEHVLFGLAATFPSFSLPGFTTVHQQLWFQTLCYYHLWQCFIIFSCRWLVCECADLRTLCIQVYSSAHNCQLHLLEKNEQCAGKRPRTAYPGGCAKRTNLYSFVPITLLFPYRVTQLSALHSMLSTWQDHSLSKRTGPNLWVC